VEEEIKAISESTEFLGITKDLAPPLVLLPSFALSLSQLREKLQGKPVVLSKNSVAVLEGAGLKLKGLSLEGGIDIRTAEPMVELAADLEVKNMGAKLAPLEEAKLTTDILKIRGYDLEVQEMWDLKTVLEKAASA